MSEKREIIGSVHGEGTVTVNEFPGTLRDWLAGRGAHGLPCSADEEVWNHFRELHGTLFDTIAAYDDWCVKRDYRFADAMLAARERKADA